jgi:Ca-activated chloride channel family protein
MPPIQRSLTLTDMRVDVRIDSGLARTTIKQTLRNDGGMIAEGSYMLPLPKGAVISDFALIDGDRRLTPELLDAKQARDIYQEIVRKVRDPGLLEFQDNGTFRVSVFPFQPGETRSVEVSYSQQLEGSTSLVSYSTPLRWAAWSNVHDAAFALSYDINSAHDLGTISSPTHSVSVNREGERRAWGSIEARVGDFPSDFTLNIGRRTGEFAASLLTYPGEAGEDGYFMLSLLAALPQSDKYVPKDILFIFDKSGSMSGEKIEQTKGGLRFVLGQLKEEDRFNLVYYSDAVSTLFSDGLRSASRANRDEAQRLVDSLTADGGTDINSALSEGARMLRPDGRPTYVIFMTDGLPTVGEVDVNRIIENAKAGMAGEVKLFVFGVGYDVNTTLLDSISYNHHGSASYVGPGQDIEVEVSRFYAKMASPALVDIDIEIAGMQIHDLMPRELPDLFHNNEVFVTGRYKGTAPSKATVNVRGRGETGERTLSAAVDVSGGSRHNQVPRLWANRKVSFLLDQVRLKGDNPELLTEIDRLATRYGIVTPYTSYLITEPGMYFAPEARRQALDDEMQLAREEESGERAVGRSKVNQSNQAADVASAPQVAGAAGGGMDSPAFLPPPSPRSEDYQGSADPNSTVNYVNNQTFVQQSEDSRTRWVDARFKDSMRRVQVTAFSDEYFELLNEFPELADYLAQGQEVTVQIGDELVLETVVDEVSNTASELEEVRSALRDGGYL